MDRVGYELLYNYYIGNQVILTRSFEDTSKPNNRVVNNLCAKICDTHTSYLSSTPVKHVFNNEVFDTLYEGKPIQEHITRLLLENDIHDVNSELDHLANLYGHSFEIHYIDADGNQKFRQRSPRNMFAIYSDDLSEELLAVVDIFTAVSTASKEEAVKADVYTSDNIYTYSIEEGAYTKIATNSHTFGIVPAIEFPRNSYRIGSFEGILTQQDAYNVSVSDSINDIEYFTNSYLVITGLPDTDGEDLADMKNNRVIILEEGGKAEFLNRQVEDTHVENTKNRLIKDIAKDSHTPQIASSDLGANASGASLNNRLAPLEDVTAIRERKFKTAMKRRLKLILTTLQAKSGINLQGYENDIEIVFTRNLLSNISDLADAVVKLRGVVSDQTLRSQVPWVLDVSDEAELIAAEAKDKLQRELTLESALIGAAPIDSQEVREANQSDYDEGHNEHNLKLEKGDG